MTIWQTVYLVAAIVCMLGGMVMNRVDPVWFYPGDNKLDNDLWAIFIGAIFPAAVVFGVPAALIFGAAWLVLTGIGKALDFIVDGARTAYWRRKAQ